ncbi:MAG TPA: hypothetical protein VLC74_05750 [Rhizomicrobium sp.]|nr:hypothetical protein [Rhizomicrobium sp.]
MAAISAPDAGAPVSGPLSYRAELDARWLFDPASHCYVFAFGDVPADEVRWAGPCVKHVASGAGAAMFTYRGRFAEFASGNFVNGAADGPVQIEWPKGARLEAKAHFGRLVGKAIVTFATAEAETRSAAATSPANVPPLEAARDRAADPATEAFSTGTATIAADANTRLPSFEKPAVRADRQALAPEPIPVRDSVIHLIDGAAGPILADADTPPHEGGRVAEARPPSQCLSVDTDEGDVGFRNSCTFPVRFAYCIAHAARADVTSCDGQPETGEVRPDSFAALFGAFGQPDYDLRWIACDAHATNPVPRLIRSDPPAGQCLPRRLAAKR